VLVARSVEAALAALRPTGRAPLEFESVGVLRPTDLTFIPLYRIYGEKYAVYFPLHAADDWARREGELRAEAENQRRRDAATLESVALGYQQPEVDHGYVGENSDIEEFSNRKGRFASDGGWFSYTLRCNGESASLVLTYWGGVWHERIFDLSIDDQPLAEQRLLANRPGDFFERVIAIPAAMTQGREKFTLRVSSRRGDSAGGASVCVSSKPPQPLRSARSPGSSSRTTDPLSGWPRDHAHQGATPRNVSAKIRAPSAYRQALNP